MRGCGPGGPWSIVAPTDGERPSAEVSKAVASERGPRSVSDRISEGAESSFVGREAELDALASALRAPELPFVVAFVHGPGRIGKSGLIAAARSALGGAVRFVALDSRDFEPTPKGFLAALGAGLGSADGEPGLDDVSALLAGDGTRTVLALDGYEGCMLIDSWL